MIVGNTNKDDHGKIVDDDYMGVEEVEESGMSSFEMMKQLHTSVPVPANQLGPQRLPRSMSDRRLPLQPGKAVMSGVRYE